MTRRDEILKVGLEYGWEEVNSKTMFSRDMLLLTRPAPLAYGEHLVEVVFRDHAHTTVSECRTGVDRLHTRLTGGHQAIKRHLRWNGSKK